MLFPTTRRLRVAPLLFLVLLLVLPLGCQHPSTQVSWKPTDAVPISLTREKDGRWNAHLAVPVGTVVQSGLEGVRLPPLPFPCEWMGYISIDHSFDFREDSTYIIIRNHATGKDAIIRLGIKASLKLHITGEHNLTLQREAENKFLIDDEVLSGKMDITFYPLGPEQARVAFDMGPTFVFLANKQLHIEYQTMLQADDSLPMDTIQSVTYREGYQLGVIALSYNRGDKTLEFRFPRNNTNQYNVGLLQQSFQEVAPQVEFRRINIVRRSYTILSFLALLDASLFLVYYMNKPSKNTKNANKSKSKLSKRSLYLGIALALFAIGFFNSI